MFPLLEAIQADHLCLKLRSSNNIGDERAKEIGLTLQNNNRLVELYIGMILFAIIAIGFNNIGDEGAKEIGLGLQKNYTLIMLDLGMLHNIHTVHRVQQYWG
eukprot:TRINITY_DN814_c3_g1_i2.p8 TRINITY_DN814_c3_g1~~TRINITY_DN814_c3_g1_i2.p8  ORF type:complete len:102 (-),score=5.57 TRINITY_DN814_c3_g1_i2:1198-1503(-)